MTELLSFLQNRIVSARHGCNQEAAHRDGAIFEFIIRVDAVVANIKPSSGWTSLLALSCVRTSRLHFNRFYLSTPDPGSLSARSKGARNILRLHLQFSEKKLNQKGAYVAALSYVYNHHERELSQLLASIPHSYHDLTISTMHPHLDHE